MIEDEEPMSDDGGLTRVELHRLMHSVAQIGAEVHLAKHERTGLLSELRGMAATIAEIKQAIIQVAVFTENLSQLRSSVHDRFSKLQIDLGRLDQGIEGAANRVEVLENWRQNEVVTHAVNKVWVGWVIAIASSIATVALTEGARRAFGR